MPRGGARPGAGRKPGGHNKISKAAREAAAQTGALPHEILLEAARTGKLGKRALTLHQQLFAASASAAYYAPRLGASANLSVSPAKPADFNLLEVARSLGYVLAAAGNQVGEQSEPAAPVAVPVLALPAPLEGQIVEVNQCDTGAPGGRWERWAEKGSSLNHEEARRMKIARGEDLDAIAEDEDLNMEQRQLDQAAAKIIREGNDRPSAAITGTGRRPYTSRRGG